MLRKRIAAAIVAAAAVIGSSTAIAVTSSTARAATSVPAFDHIVLVMFENHAYSQINGSSSAPYFNGLAGQGAKFTQSFAVTHPSEPNYLAIFSGSTQGITDDSCPHTFGGNNIANQVLTSGRTYKSYSESMPSDGYTGCSSGQYARKHNAAPFFSTVPAGSNRMYSEFPSSSNYASLPTVSYVAPNLCNDMHDCSIGTGDTWLKNNMDAYAQWAKTHNSLLIVTFDEDNGSSSNHIFTVFVGAHTQVGSFSNQINHYNVLSTVESAYGLSHLNAASAITNVWN
ncbi:MAG TPA: alkaline phosphatase family protein [Amycolatopsis sp.]|uniref:alkaline phosphatase family protein n=1 Tax=Amycolatopsis sp. TaxID=37632 RepID=UPI002B4A9CEF|nr:alkaline phosphatase family protein [Amycolatopsis sp.]HKS48540.1 alkaline phosphatase family protein [Amycolatopsis sp.]